MKVNQIARYRIAIDAMFQSLPPYEWLSVLLCPKGAASRDLALRVTRQMKLPAARPALVDPPGKGNASCGAGTPGFNSSPPPRDWPVKNPSSGLPEIS
jgi:hypothetical protein